MCLIGGNLSGGFLNGDRYNKRTKEWRITMFGMTETLIVVYKDEMLVNQLKKMVETKDDTDNEQIGTRDGSINIVAWSEKVWLANKKAGNIKDKVLFLGDVKGTDKLIPVIDVKFDEYGVRFGWAGNQAVLYTDIKMLSKREDYLEFIGKLSVLPVPSMIKEPKNVRTLEDKTEDTLLQNEIIVTEQDEKKKVHFFFEKAKEALDTGVDVVGKMGNQAMLKAEDIFRDKNAVKQQMLFYGIVNLYIKGLDAFMKN